MLPLPKKRDYYWMLDLLPGLALGQSFSKGVLTIYHGSPEASGWAAAITLALGGGIGYVLCHYVRTQFTKNMQSRGAVISWSFAISFGLVLAILTATALLTKSAERPHIYDAFAPGYVAPFDQNSVVPDGIDQNSVVPDEIVDAFAPGRDPNQEYLKEVVKTNKQPRGKPRGIRKA